jgi:serine/threonine protein kinase
VLTFFPRVRSTTPGAFNIAAGAEPAPGYRLLRLRGRGGFAEVWEATSPGGPPVALKFIVSSNVATTARELRSHQSLMALDHPHLVQNHGVWSVPGYIVLCMELADASLLDLMLLYLNDLQKAIDPPILSLYMWQIATALDFLNTKQHTRDGRKVGYQHGDIKPNNILIVGDKAKLTDYGLASPVYGPNTPCPRQGTREYAPPEVFAGYLSDTSDQFSLAITYFVLRTGHFPFPSPPAELSRTFNRPHADLTGVLPNEQSILRKALSPVPQARYGSCREMMACLIRAHGLKAIAHEDGVWKIVPEEETVPDALPLPPKSGVVSGTISRLRRNLPPDA